MIELATSIFKFLTIEITTLFIKPSLAGAWLLERLVILSLIFCKKSPPYFESFQTGTSKSKVILPLFLSNITWNDKCTMIVSIRLFF